MLRGMQLDYLLFDATDEEDGSCSFDALASVLPDRLPALVREVETVLAWAHGVFGAPMAGAEAGAWDYELQAAEEPGQPLEARYDADRARLSLVPAPQGRAVLALTVTGSPVFAAAFRDAFPEAA